MTLLQQSQTTSTICMIDPVDFSFNEETAVDNEFQNAIDGDGDSDVNARARQEFAQSVQMLRDLGVNVIVLGKSDKNANHKIPDAVFPNNWISTHADGTIVMYQMYAQNRRHETNSLQDLLEELKRQGFSYKEPIVYLSDLSAQQEFLESTGSMVIDHTPGQVVYAAKSIRTSPVLLKELFDRTGFYRKLMLFDTRSSNGKPFYHTNVMMSIGTGFAVVCSECIVDNELCTKQQVLDELKSTGRDIIDITFEQAERYFCGNCLEVKSATTGEALIVMSDSAYKGFTEEQRATMSKHGKLVQLPISSTIEYVGGGSARCMMMEIFTPKQGQEQQ